MAAGARATAPWLAIALLGLAASVVMTVDAEPSEGESTSGFAPSRYEWTTPSDEVGLSMPIAPSQVLVEVEARSPCRRSESIF